MVAPACNKGFHHEAHGGTTGDTETNITTAGTAAFYFHHGGSQWSPVVFYELKGDLFKNEGKRCWICGDENNRLEVHEFWKYNKENGEHIQRLLGIHHLCFLCHKIKHIGFARTENGLKGLQSRGYPFEDLIKHFCKVNNCSREDFEKHHS
jgi:hypothetical protein